MKEKQTLSRWMLAKKLQDLALRIAAGKPVRIGDRSVRIPDHVTLEAEVETEDGETELEFEITWKAPKAKAKTKTK